MRKVLTVALAGILIAINLQPAQSAGPIGVGEANIAAVYELDQCRTASQLDCLESVGLLSEDGSYTNAKLELAQINGVTDDQFGNKIYNGDTFWKAGNTDIRINAQLETPEHIILRSPDGNLLRGGALRISIIVDKPLETKVRVKVRTSWLRPQSIQIKLSDSDYKDELITGGHRWTFEGKGLPHSSYDYSKQMPENQRPAKADYDGILSDIFIHHAGIDAQHSYFPPVCADQGYTVQSNNTNATGEPSWDAKDETLIFGIFAPHLTAQGELNKGYFKFWTSDKFLNCKFPTNTLSASPNLNVQILYEDGTQAVATTQVTHKDGKIFVLAAGFHFSSPKIVITPDKTAIAPIKEAAKPTPSASPSPSATPTATAAKKISITCMKGKTKKTVSAVKPTCPAGYKKVS